MGKCGREEWKMERMESGKKSGSVNQAMREKPDSQAMRFGVASMEESLNSLNFFIVEQQKSEAPLSLEDVRLGACCLTILIYTFKMFKGATNPCYTYIPRFKGISLQEKRYKFTGEKV